MSRRQAIYFERMRKELIRKKADGTVFVGICAKLGEAINFP